MIRVEQVGGTSLDRLNKILASVPKGAIRAGYNAAKRAGQTAKTKAGQFAAAEYTISKGTFMANVDTKTTLEGHSWGVASISISFSGQVLPLVLFHTRAGPGGVTAKVKRSGGGVLQHAFRIDAFGGGIFERVGPSRFPVEQKYGPSTGHMMQEEHVVEQMDKTLRETFEQRMEHEMLRIMNGW